MRFLQNAVFAALKRAQFFLDEYAAVFAALVHLTAARKRLDAVVASFADHAYNQDAGDRGAKGETAKQHQLRVPASCLPRRATAALRPLVADVQRPHAA